MDSCLHRASEELLRGAAVLLPGVRNMLFPPRRFFFFPAVVGQNRCSPISDLERWIYKATFKSRFRFCALTKTLSATAFPHPTNLSHLLRSITFFTSRPGGRFYESYRQNKHLHDQHTHSVTWGRFFKGSRFKDTQSAAVAVPQCATVVSARWKKPSKMLSDCAALCHL